MSDPSQGGTSVYQSYSGNTYLFGGFNSNGKEAGIEMWTMDQKDGDFITYNDEGLILAKSTFKKDLAVGEHLVNDEKGKTIHQTIYDKKGAKQYEMEIDEYGDKKVLFDIIHSHWIHTNFIFSGK